MNLPATAAAPACGNCHSHQRWVLHHVRLRGIIRRLCTSCVLLSHPSCFCPSCFQVYDAPSSAASGGPNANPPPPASKRVTCVKCSSISHSHCVNHPSPSVAYLCPPCANPKFSFFEVDSKPEAMSNRALDKKLALVLLCAARIASSSMSKAAVAAREEAVKRALEASMARKRAREALDNLAVVVSKEKARRKEASSVEVVSGTVNAGVKDRFPNRITGSVVKSEHSGEVSANFSSAVGLRHSHSEGFDRFLAQNAASSLSKNGLSRVSVGGERKNLGLDSGVSGNGSLNEKDRVGNAVKAENNNGKMQLPQNNNGKDDKVQNKL